MTQVLQRVARQREVPGPAFGTSRPVEVTAGGVALPGEWTVPSQAIGRVIVACTTGSGHVSPRLRALAGVLNRSAIATLLLDLLATGEEGDRRLRADTAMLARRLSDAVTWVQQGSDPAAAPLGLLGSGMGAVAALSVAARRPGEVAAVVCRGGRSGADAVAWSMVTSPTLLIVGSADSESMIFSQGVAAHLGGVAKLASVPGATHLFEESGALEQVAALAAAWFERWFAA